MVRGFGERTTSECEVCPRGVALESSAAGCLGFRRDFLMLSVILSRIGYDSACCWVGEFRAVTTVSSLFVSFTNN